ncbi:MAG: hypothetical protein WCG98_00020 [bacterium]
MVTAPSLGLNEATIMESAKKDPACHSPPYPTIMTLIFPNASVCISSPMLLETIFTVPLAMPHNADCAKLMRYLPRKITKNMQIITKSTFPNDRLRLGLSISLYDV